MHISMAVELNCHWSQARISTYITQQTIDYLYMRFSQLIFRNKVGPG